MFLEVARSGSFRAAAQKLGQSVNALRRKIEGFERELGVPLLTRHVNGVRPTKEGVSIYNAALQMENASFDLLLARNTSGKQIEGEVQIAVTEGLGIYWLLPHLAEFQQANPKLTVNLRCAAKPADLHRLEADISIQLQRPENLDLKVVKLGRLHARLFAAKPYIESYGRPESIADLTKHHIAVMSYYEGQWEEAYRQLLPGISPAGLVVLRNNLSSVHAWSIYRGLGIGWLPTYVQAIGANLVQLDIGAVAQHDIWLTYRSEAKRIERVQKTIDWVIQCFDPRRYPWFRDEFVHPDQFSKLYKGAPLQSVFLDLQAKK